MLTAGKKNVGIRIPNHQLTLELLDLLNFPLAVPSANIYGSISATNSKNIIHQFGNKIKYILDGGDSSKGIESTIIGFENKQTIIHRLGAISKEEIEKVIQSKAIIKDVPHQKNQLITNTPLIVVNDKKKLYELPSKKDGIIHFNTKSNTTVPIQNQLWLSNSSDLNEAAKNIRFTHIDLLIDNSIDLM